MAEHEIRSEQCVLLDWGDTVMRVFPNYSGPMDQWPTVAPVDGIHDAVMQLRRHALLCIATNAEDSKEWNVRRALGRVSLDTSFDRVFCFDVVGHRKPSEAFYRRVLNLMEMPPEKVFMVGDDFETDVVGAVEVGMRSVWLNQFTNEDRSGDLYATAHSAGSIVRVLETLGLKL